jgi:hypothetical protein
MVPISDAPVVARPASRHHPKPMRRLVAVSAIAFGCTWPEHAFREIATDAGGSDRPPTSCPIAAELAALCAELRAFDGPFVVDGLGDEFCRIRDGRPATPPRRFSIARASATDPSPPPALPQQVEVRAGLSSFGAHVFVQVRGDPRVIVDRDDPTSADAVEIFLRGRRDELVGDLERDAALHLVIAPDDGGAAIGLRYLEGRPRASLLSSSFAARRVSGGYEVELHLPWSEIGEAVSPGMLIGFDVAIDVKDDERAPGRQARAYLHLEPLAGSAPCTALGAARPEPWCDSRTWCAAKAYVP